MRGEQAVYAYSVVERNSISTCVAPASRRALSLIALAIGALLLGTACPPSDGPCSSHDDCEADQLCVDGVCAQACNSELDCIGRERCLDGVCVAALPDRDAGPGDGGQDATTGPEAVRLDVARPDAAAADVVTGDAAVWPDAIAEDAPLPGDAAVVEDGSSADAVMPQDAAGDAAGGDASAFDAANEDSGTLVPTCGTVDLMRDDFDDSVADWRWEPFAGAGASVSRAHGVLAISLPGGSGASAWAGYSAGLSTSLLDRALTVELQQGTALLSEAQTSLVFMRDSGNQLYITQAGSSLRATHVVVGVLQTASAVYDSAAHRWLRIREQAGTVEFGTSPDGQTWSVLLEAATPAFASSGQVQLEAGIEGGAGAPNTVVFDNLNVGRSASSWCAASSPQDSFDGPGLLPIWEVPASSDCSVDLEGGRLQLSVDQPMSCSVISRSGYLLDELGVEIELAVPVGGSVDGWAGLGLWSPNGDTYFELSVSADGLAGYYENLTGHGGAATVSDVRWLRLRKEVDTLRWEVRSSSSGWQELYSLVVPGSVGPFMLKLWVTCGECLNSQETPAQVSFDNLNLP